MSACAEGLPQAGTLPGLNEATKSARERFEENTPGVAIRRIRVPASSMSSHPIRQTVSSALRARRISIKLPGLGNNLGDLSQALTAADIQIAFAFAKSGGSSSPSATGGAAGRPGAAAPVAAGGASSGGSDGVLKQPLPFNEFRGTLGEMLDALKTGSGIISWQEGNIIYFSDVSRYSISLPQNEDVIKSMAETIKNLGATDVVTSVDAGKIVYSAKPSLEEEIIEPFMKRTLRNLATVDIQVAIVSLALTDKTAQGFDWSKFSTILDQRASALGQARNTTVAQPAGTGTAATTGGTNPATVNSTVGALGSQSTTKGQILPQLTLDQSGAVAAVTSGAAVLGGTATQKLFGVQTAFSVASTIEFLSTFGNTNVTQNVELRTLSGRQVKFKSGDTIPYVKSIGNNSSGGSGVSGGTNSLGTAQTETIKTGLSVELTPRYDSDAEIVTADLKMTLSSLVEFVQLSAGNQLGTLSQPHTSDQELSDIIRMKVGNTIVLGGLQYDSETFDGNEPTALRSRLAENSLATGLRKKNVSRNALFIIMKPSVTVYEVDKNLKLDK